MSLIPANEMKSCFIPCSKEKIEAGQCGCHNRIMWHEMPLFTRFNIVETSVKLKKEENITDNKNNTP